MSQVQEIRLLESNLAHILSSNHIMAEVWSMDNKLHIEIMNGDWKHDHARADLLAREYLQSRNCAVLNRQENVIEEDGSDTYSSDHVFELDLKQCG